MAIRSKQAQRRQQGEQNALSSGQRARHHRGGVGVEEEEEVLFDLPGPPLDEQVRIAPPLPRRADPVRETAMILGPARQALAIANRLPPAFAEGSLFSYAAPCSAPKGLL